MVSPESTHIIYIVHTEQVIFRNTRVSVNIYLYTITANKNVMNLKDRMRRKREGENDIIVL